jgi:hypothetical protein
MKQSTKPNVIAEKEGISIIWYTVFQNKIPMLHHRRETLKKVFFTVCFETTLNM